LGLLTVGQSNLTIVRLLETFCAQTVGFLCLLVFKPLQYGDGSYLEKASSETLLYQVLSPKEESLFCSTQTVCRLMMLAKNNGLLPS
jgi:hypothetical protein